MGFCCKQMQATDVHACTFLETSIARNRTREATEYSFFECIQNAPVPVDDLCTYWLLPAPKTATISKAIWKTDARSIGALKPDLVQKGSSCVQPLVRAIKALARGRTGALSALKTYFRMPPAPNEQSAAFLKDGLSQLQKIPSDGRLCCVSLSLSSRGLSQLLLVCDFSKLLCLDVSNNKLECLYPVRLAANLVHLNARNNLLKSAAELSANTKLQTADLRNNHIEELGDWQFNGRLRVLLLGGNRLASLATGNLSSNSLLRELDIGGNNISSLEPLPYLKCLDTLNASNNLLTNLQGIQGAPNVVVLHAELAAAEAFGDLLYARRRVWESLIPEEPFVDRRLVKLVGAGEAISPATKH
ncbi:uncharacterized protein LOC34617809 [Cyclospora cayetanensis]|uniref:Uncharacterized protein LOC34617809 n=1 Tax=Cyclospora cayetanensis TaxID=88456 RepID=A0A6P6RZ30_9EIME|nr:uncharacterized protein LOC34617809 [Cyclospora cayetanensis]